MARGLHGGVWRHTCTLFRQGVTGDVCDEQLLERFVTAHPETSEMAFESLVERHGPMVLRICRTILRDQHDAEDAFQATFLVLARAASIRRRTSLASWLHGVARRVASGLERLHPAVGSMSGKRPNWQSHSWPRRNGMISRK